MGEDRILCTPLDTDHGSDHAAIQTVFTMATPEIPFAFSRRLFKNAPWNKICQTVTENIHLISAPSTNIVAYANQLLQTVQIAINTYIPLAKPSLYTKRWWCKDLTFLYKEYICLRNRFHRAKRHNLSNSIIAAIDTQTWATKQAYFIAVRKQRKEHWEDFLDNSENIWQAAKYLSDHTVKPLFPTIARVRNSFDLEVKTPENIGNMLLENFFPLPPAQPRSIIDSSCPSFLETSQLPGISLMLEEVHHAIFKAFPLKGPGEDGLPALVWQKLWPVLQHHIFTLFEAFLKQGKLPKAWKMAKIIPLKKPSKPDYADPNAFRPISLLSTLSKAIEAVIAERINYLVERHGFLPLNHYGALKQKSTTDAFLTVQEKIYQA